MLTNSNEMFLKKQTDKGANMSFLFGKRKTPEQMLRENQRLLQRSIRDLDRERTRMETQEKKVIADIKKMAKAGQMDAVKVMAKDLVRTRQYIIKFMLKPVAKTHTKFQRFKLSL